MIKQLLQKRKGRDRQNISMPTVDQLTTKGQAADFITLLSHASDVIEEPLTPEQEKMRIQERKMRQKREASEIKVGPLRARMSREGERTLSAGT